MDNTNNLQYLIDKFLLEKTTVAILNKLQVFNTEEVNYLCNLFRLEDQSIGLTPRDKLYLNLLLGRERIVEPRERELEELQDHSAVTTKFNPRFLEEDYDDARR